MLYIYNVVDQKMLQVHYIFYAKACSKGLFKFQSLALVNVHQVIIHSVL